MIIKSRGSQYRQKIEKASIAPRIARWHKISRADQKRTSHARRKSAMFNRARWQRWSADSLKHRSSDKWKDATHAVKESWQAGWKHWTRRRCPALKKSRTRRGFLTQELELKNCLDVYSITPLKSTLGEWFFKARFSAKLTKKAAWSYDRTNKISSNLLIPSCWKDIRNMRRAWSVLGRRGRICQNGYQKKWCVSILKTHQNSARSSSNTRVTIVCLYLENTPEGWSSRLSPSSEPQIDISSKRQKTLNVSSIPLAFPLRRKILTTLLTKTDWIAREVTQNLTRWRCRIVK